MESQKTATILVTEDKTLLATLKQLLLPPVFELEVYSDITSAKHKINSKHYPLVMVDLTDKTDLMDALDISDELSLIILIVDPSRLDHISYRVAPEGVIAVSRNTDVYGFYNIIRIAMAVTAKVHNIAIKETKLKVKMEEIKIISQAKLHLMETKGLSEADAHRYIEKLAMDTRKKRATVAREILEK